MYNFKSVGEALRAEVVVASIVAKHLGLSSNFFSQNLNPQTFNNEIEIFKIEGVVHLKLPPSLKNGIANYQSILLNIDEDEEEFDYVVPLNSNKKIGFWR